jgi:hypothetical protein
LLCILLIRMLMESVVIGGRYRWKGFTSPRRKTARLPAQEG